MRPIHRNKHRDWWKMKPPRTLPYRSQVIEYRWSAERVRDADAALLRWLDRYRALVPPGLIDDLNEAIARVVTLNLPLSVALRDRIDQAYYWAGSRVNAMTVEESKRMKNAIRGKP